MRERKTYRHIYRQKLPLGGDKDPRSLQRDCSMSALKTYFVQFLSSIL